MGDNIVVYRITIAPLWWEKNDTVKIRKMIRSSVDFFRKMIRSNAFWK